VLREVDQPLQSSVPATLDAGAVGVDLHPSRQEITAASRAGRPTSRRPIALAVVSFVVYAMYSVLQYRRMDEPSWDLGIFTQAVKGYAHLQAPVAYLRGTHLSVLGDHFSPILAVLAPFYRVFPSPLTLQVAQAALFAVAVVPITRLAIGLLGRRTGVAIGVSYSLAWGIQSALGADFHEIAFAVPLLAFALEALVRERWRAATLWALPLLLVKEDMGLTVAAIGLYMVIRHQRRRGVALIVGGLAAVVLTVVVIIPAFNPAHQYMYWGMVNTAGSTNPWSLITHLVVPWTKLNTMLLLVAAGGLVALRSPLMIVCAPTLLWRFESANPTYWGTDWHYSAVLMPVVFVALIDGVVRARRSEWTWLRSLAGYAPRLAVVTAFLLCLEFPLHTLFDSTTYAPAPAAATAALAQIPAGATVETDLVDLMPPLVAHHKVYAIGDDPGVTPDYVAVDTSVTGSAPDPGTVTYVDSLHPGTPYRLIFHQGAYDVLEAQTLR
jgi:uncharacterized membrane protein